MGLWTLILLVSVGVPSLGACWLVSQGARRDKVRLGIFDGDHCDAEEIRAAFGATQDWV